MGGRGQTERAHKRDGESLQRRRREKRRVCGRARKKKAYVCGMEMKDMQMDGRMDGRVARPFLKCLMALISPGDRGRETNSGQTISRRESRR